MLGGDDTEAPFLHFLQQVLHLCNNPNPQAKRLRLIKSQLSEHLYTATIILQGSGERSQQLLSNPWTQVPVAVFP